MFFDFCVGPAAASGAPYGLDTIYWIWGDASYQTPRKVITPGKTYMVFTVKGEGRVRYDDKVYHVAQGQALAMRPTYDFSYGCPGESWHFWWFELCQPQPFLPENQVLSVDLGDFLLRLFKHSLICAKQGQWDIAQSLLAPALMLLGDSTEQRSPDAGSKTLIKLEQHIRENLQTVTVTGLCEEARLQERTLRNLCHRVLGYGPKQLISRIRLETAQQMLANTTLSLNDISMALGFSSQFHFSRSFKECYRLTPSDYRKQNAF